jgi:hypothetical protein
VVRPHGRVRHGSPGFELESSLTGSESVRSCPPGGNVVPFPLAMESNSSDTPAAREFGPPAARRSLSSCRPSATMRRAIEPRRPKANLLARTGTPRIPNRGGDAGRTRFGGEVPSVESL